MRWIWLFLALFIVLAGCSQEDTASDSQPSEDSPSRSDPSIQLTDVRINIVPQAEAAPNRIAGTVTPYYEFEQATYEKAMAEGKTIFLNFYASWCPICTKEHPEILAAFNELQEENVAGFQVHYNDDEVTDAERELARQFGIGYQHTKLIIKDGEVVKRTLEAMKKDEIKALIEALA